MIKKELQSLGFKIFQVESFDDVYNCLKRFSSCEVILIENPKEFNLTILQSNQKDHFSLGFDDEGEIETDAIVTANKHTGINTIGLSAKTIVIFKDHKLVNRFLKSRSINHIFNF